MRNKKSVLEINRANSQHPTGPKTSAGKKRSSLNALRHGLTGQLVVMPTEDLDAYQRHLKSFPGEYCPKGATEAHLVQDLADTSWRLNRVAALETNILTLAAAHQPDPIDGALDNLSMHTQRLSRQFEKTVTLLRDLQETRQHREEQELGDLLDVMEMCEDQGELYDPSDDGFVFSQTEIDSAIHARNRKHRVSEAFSYHHAA